MFVHTRVKHSSATSPPECRCDGPVKPGCPARPALLHRRFYAASTHNTPAALGFVQLKTSECKREEANAPTPRDGLGPTHDQHSDACDDPESAADSACDAPSSIDVGLHPLLSMPCGVFGGSVPRVSVAVPGDWVIVGSGGPRVARAASVTGDRGLRRSVLQQDQASARVRGHEPNTVRRFQAAAAAIAMR